MSDFDKEAERERLREKYERDEAEREATQRMSDLLLKGARMTNTHCDTCGDPLFQQNGVTFCPNCHGGPEAVDGSTPGAGAEQTPDATAEPSEAGAKAADDEPASSDAGSPGTADETQRVPQEATAESATREPQPTTDRVRSVEPTRVRRPSGEADLEAGRAALIEALERFASEAAATDDPRYARECLEAAREASEAIAALNR
ncbi:Sjogren's syndrome/scleroderma autoantigen 1 family protein [Natrialbaceae archaeon A-gly3]